MKQVEKFILLILVVVVLSSCTSRDRKSMNVIYITMEDLSAGLLGCYGNNIVSTPNLDAFANQSVLFEDCHCQVALCTPSRTSILTGIRPSTSDIVKIDDDWKSILPNTISLPRHFRNSWYYTSKVGKISDPRNGGMDSAWTNVREEWGIENNSLVIEALQEATGQDKPFFLAIGYKQAHDPWHPSDESLSLYNQDSIPLPGDGMNYKGKEYNEKEVKQLLQSYYASISDVDKLIGELLQEIDRLGFFNNSIVLVGVMDHGYLPGIRGKWGKGGVSDMETHVPLLVRMPGLSTYGKRAGGLVELVDIYPTLLEMCQLSQPVQELEGMSFLPLLENPSLSWKKAVFTHRAYASDIVGVKTKEYTLIQYPDKLSELYDRKRDPHGLVNIAAENPEELEMMEEIALKGWQNAQHLK